MQMTDELGLMYIAEQTSPDENTVKNLKCTDKANSFFVEFDTILQSFSKLNRNKRMYLANNIGENLKTPRIQSMLRTNGWYGEQDHPLQITEDGKLTPERVKTIYMPNRSHKIINPTVDGNLLRAKIETASGTEAGRGMAMEIIQGLIPCFSCRAIASLTNTNGMPTVWVRMLVTYDWVLFPSHEEAEMQGAPVAKSRSLGTITEKAQDTIGSALKRFKKFSETVTVPLHEIIEYTGKHDTNTQIILESFGLDESNMVGFDKEFNHAVIKNDDNYIYANISPRTKSEVMDFLSSF